MKEREHWKNRGVFIMALAFFLLFGGLTSWIAIAWYHEKHPDKRNS